jgi:hypothetical protein
MSKKKIFTENDYNSGDGMMTSVWGPPLWHTLHTISFNYPVNPTKEHKKNYYKFYSNLVNVLPCKYCRDNLKKNLEKHPLTMSVFENRNSLSRWVYELHEIINKMLGKDSGLSYEDVKDRYEYFRARCVINPKEYVSTKIEKGCTEPLYGVKSKCIINIVPRDNRKSSFKMDPQCEFKKKKSK